MKHTLLLLLTLCIQLTTAQAQHELIIGNRDTLFSDILNETREIWVSVPSTYNTDYQKQDYPVMYVLDGPDHFLSVAGLIDRLSTNTGREVCPQMIVVGIVNTHRDRDLFAKKKDDAFGQFLAEELIPYIDDHYPTIPYRAIMGHSFGGIRVVHSAIYQPDLFNAYIAMDASLGQDYNSWYNMVQPELETFQLGNRNMFLAMAWTMGDRVPKNLAAVKADTTGHSRHMRTQMRFSELMTANTSKESKAFEWKFYPEENHQSLTVLATYDGLHAIFNWYSFKRQGEIFDPETTPEAAVQLLKDHYKTLSSKFGVEKKPPAKYLAAIADYLLFAKNQKQKGHAFATYFLEQYPDSKAAKRQFEIAQNNLKPSVIDLLKTGKPTTELIAFCKKDSAKGANATYNLGEKSLNSEGYVLLMNSKYEPALTVFTINSALHPKSANVYDSLGECLMLMGKEAEGIAAYKKAVAINPKVNPHALKLIEEYEERN